MDFGGVGAGAVGNHQNVDINVMAWYMEIPLISRLYLTGAFLTTAACAVDIISPFSLYFNWDLVFEGQVWRLITSYLFFGVFSVDFLFHMYFLVSHSIRDTKNYFPIRFFNYLNVLVWSFFKKNRKVRYSRLLEEGDFRGRTANYVLMLMFGILCISVVAIYTHVHFLGSALTFMMVYVWGRRNEDVRMSFLGFFTFNAPYLPWVMLGFSILLGNGITMDLIGIVVGHTYYFLEFVYPIVADIRGWRVKRILEPPTALHWLCGNLNLEQHVHLHQD